MFIKTLMTLVSAVLLCEHSVHCQNVENIANDIRIRFYTGPNTWQLYSVQSLHNVRNHQNFNLGRDSVFYHYGFSQTINSENVRDVISSSTSVNDRNFFMIYYLSVLINVSANAPAIADHLANAYINLHDAGYPSSRIHLVGFSLGAQIQAIASRNVQNRTNRRVVIGRLTGLDPGQPSPALGRLSAADAAFVDSIHTESVGFGDSTSIGHVAYFVNGGIRQPFCAVANMVCSHNFAPTAWAESIRARLPVFPSLACSSWENFQSGQCNNGAVGNMGMHTSRASRGSHFLRTNLEAPFSRLVPTP